MAVSARTKDGETRRAMVRVEIDFNRATVAPGACLIKANLRLSRAQIWHLIAPAYSSRPLLAMTPHPPTQSTHVNIHLCPLPDVVAFDSMLVILVFRARLSTICDPDERGLSK